jgi:DNA polymerase III epsilon subunit-like protein
MSELIYPTRYIALDVETSGLNSTYDQIMQIAVVPMERGEIVGDPYYTRILPSSKFSIKREALEVQAGEVTGDTLKEWWDSLTRDGVESREAMSGLIEWSRAGNYGGLPVVAHNASFDWGFVNQWIFIWRVMAGQKSPLGPWWICTKTLAQNHSHFEGCKKFGLDVVAAGCGLPPRPKEHDALQDAILAGQVYHRLTTGEGL